MLFNLTQILTSVPNEHVLNGINEVLESFRWGLTELGHQVSTQTNNAYAGAVNIIFGYQMLDERQMSALPENTIIYNLEDLEMVPLAHRKRSIVYAAEHFRVWDFYEGNLPAWREHKLRFPPVHVPLGYAPTLSRIPRRPSQMIDVLFYGYPKPPRLDILRHLAQYGVRLVFACGLYGPPRDDLISHSKIVLNLNKNTEGRMYELVRVSFLLANAKAVVSDVYPNSNIEPDIREAVEFTPREQITATCLRLLADEKALASLGQRGFETFKKRDIRQILSMALLSK
jgi:hypothetical protein